MSCALYLLLTFVVMLSLHQHQFLSEALQWRAQTDPDHILYVLLNAKVDWPHNHPQFNEVDLINSSNSNGLEKDTAANISAYSSPFPVC